MRKSTIILSVFVAVALILASAATTMRPGVDARISARVAAFISQNLEYSNLRFNVDDAIVTLQGTVRLESQRQIVIQRIRKMPEVAGVNAEILLDPPALADDILFPRVLSRLASLHLSELRVSVREGLVTISGSVRTDHDRQMVLATVQGIEGVREVVSELRVEEGY
jgi:hyperosmotically inducible periplasmic protein